MSSLRRFATCGVAVMGALTLGLGLVAPPAAAVGGSMATTTHLGAVVLVGPAAAAARLALGETAVPDSNPCPIQGVSSGGKAALANPAKNRLAGRCDPPRPPSPPPPQPPPPPPPPPGGGPVAVTCENYDPAYIIFGDANGNRTREANEPIYVLWGFHIEWCYSADSSYPSAPVFAYTAFDRDPIIAPGSRWNQSGPPTRRDDRSWSSDRFLETVTITWGTKTFWTVVLTPFGELPIIFNPVIRLQVDGFGNEQICDLTAPYCPPIWA
jgi:hypothetical protein